MTPKRYFVVEGKTDELYLRRLLPSYLLQDTKIIAASGYSSALSTVQTLFTLTNLPVSFFFDTDTQSEDKIEENKQFINSYLKKLFNNEFLLFPFNPEIEILFFYKKELLEKIVGQPISNELWQQGQYQPARVLKQLIGNKQHIVSFFKEKLTPDLIEDLQKNPLIQDIIQKTSAEFQNEPQIITAQ